MGTALEFFQRVQSTHQRTTGGRRPWAAPESPETEPPSPPSTNNTTDLWQLLKSTFPAFQRATHHRASPPNRRAVSPRCPSRPWSTRHPRTRGIKNGRARTYQPASRNPLIKGFPTRCPTWLCATYTLQAKTSKPKQFTFYLSGHCRSLNRLRDTWPMRFFATLHHYSLRSCHYYIIWRGKKA